MTIREAVQVRRSGHYVAPSRIPEFSTDGAQKFLEEEFLQLGSQRRCSAIMLSGALQRNAKHEARLSNISV